MKRLIQLHVSKYLYMEQYRSVRIKELILNFLLFFLVWLMGSVTNLIYFTEYISAQVTLHPKHSFDMEATLNKDLYKADEPDFMFYPASDDFLLSKRYPNINLESIRLLKKSTTVMEPNATTLA